MRQQSSEQYETGDGKGILTSINNRSQPVRYKNARAGFIEQRLVDTLH